MKKQTGFTIVELLIVIVVIGILAAITIVAYNGILQRAKNTTIQSDLGSFAKTLEMVRVDTVDGNYPAAITSDMGVRATKSVYNLDRNNWYYCVSADRTEYALGVVTEGSSSGAGYILSSSNGMQEMTGVDDAKTCSIVNRLNGSHMGYNGTTKVWSGWVR